MTTLDTAEASIQRNGRHEIHLMILFHSNLGLFQAKKPLN